MRRILHCPLHTRNGRATLSSSYEAKSRPCSAWHADCLFVFFAGGLEKGRGIIKSLSTPPLSLESWKEQVWQRPEYKCQGGRLKTKRTGIKGELWQWHSGTKTDRKHGSPGHGDLTRCTGTMACLTWNTSMAQPQSPTLGEPSIDSPFTNHNTFS